MRMRKKKHLDERMAQCADYLFSMQCDDLNALTAVEKKEYIDLPALFGNNNPVVLEIGCGKGRFACELARREPAVNVLALEKARNVIVMACEQAKRENIPNVYFLHGGAEYLEKYLPPQSVDRIYLNFSCPFPKNSYANRRLTNERFLKSYAVLLRPGAEIHQKTDNMNFFEYSIEQLTHFGFALKNVSLDLHHSGFEGNIETEYESRFASQGCPIYRLEAYLK